MVLFEGWTQRCFIGWKASRRTLDKAKKDLSEIRAKTGLPDDDAKPDLERLMEEERSNIASTSREAERLLLKAEGIVPKAIMNRQSDR